MRRRLAPTLNSAAARLSVRGVRAGTLTAAALAVGVGACVAGALQVWSLALILWLLNRAFDGLDGPVARRSGASELGGLLDFVADFIVYSGFVVAVAIAEPGARLACVVLLATYLVNNVTLLSFSSLVERRGLRLGDERSLALTTGLTEGTETIVVYVLFCLFPSAAAEIAWVFAGLVAITAAQRVVTAVRVLGAGSPRPPG